MSGNTNITSDDFILLIDGDHGAIALLSGARQGEGGEQPKKEGSAHNYI